MNITEVRKDIEAALSSKLEATSSRVLISREAAVWLADFLEKNDMKARQYAATAARWKERNEVEQLMDYGCMGMGNPLANKF